MARRMLSEIVDAALATIQPRDVGGGPQSDVGTNRNLPWVARTARDIATRKPARNYLTHRSYLLLSKQVRRIERTPGFEQGQT
jgi:hypothetical protein